MDGEGVNCLPRLAVIADVPVERTHAGMLILYRLLADYPSDRLLVVDGPQFRSDGPAVRLPGVEYRRFEYPGSRPPRLPARLSPAWRVWADASMPRHAGRLAEFVRDFRPEAVMTVADYLLWTAAAAAAARLGVPLHLIVHDDHPYKMTGHSTRPWAGLLRRSYRNTFGRVYRQAASRLVVSPNMADSYEKVFGVGADVVYPNRGSDSPTPQVRVRTHAPEAPPVVAFTGSTNVGGANELLCQLADVLQGLGGELHLYTKASPEELARQGLDRPAVRLVGFLPTPKEMGEHLAANAQLLFLPASFAPGRRPEVSTLFPSKLADYTAIGLPILIWGPAYSSAARWGRENPDAAVLMTDLDGGGVAAVLQRVTRDRDWAVSLANAAIEAGSRYFDLTVARDKLYHTLTAAR